MQVFSSRARGLKVKLALAAGFLASLGLAAAFLGSVAPVAEGIAHDPDTQIAVFMVPVTLLILTMLFEVSRFVWRGRIPASTPPARRLHHWSASGKR